MTPAISLTALVASGVAAYFLWRKVMNLQESLDKTVADLGDARKAVQAQVAAIPALVTAALDKAVQNYITSHPAVEQIGGVTEASLVTALQSITDDTKAIMNAGNAVETHIADAA